MSNEKRRIVLIRAGNSAGRLPHALLCLASMLNEEALILDDADPDLIFKHKDAIKNAVCVGISTITGPYIKYSLEAAKVIRSINSRVPLVWGGWHPSLKPEQTLESSYVDKVIVGQGEQAFFDLVENIKNGRSTDNIIKYEYKDKSEFPVYNFDNIRNMERYIVPYVSPRSISLYTSQGCPFGCEFCAVNSVYGRKCSGWPTERVVGIIDNAVNKYFIDGVHFDDDNFFIGKKRPLDFANEMIKKDIRINWSSDARVDALCAFSKDEWEMLDRSGCKRLLVGAESGAQQTLNKLNKRITPDMILNFGSLCYQNNIIPSFSMMVGVPGERQEDIEETFRLLDILKERVPTSELLLFLYTPYPGTSLYNTALEMGFREPQTLEEWGQFYLDVPTVPWVDDRLIARVRKYKEIFSGHGDIGLKNKPKFKVSPYLYLRKLQNLVLRFNRTETKIEAVSHYFKKRILRKE